MSKENQNDGVNRCRRCNRPLKDPTDAYGWWCAQIVGLDNYKKADETLDDDVLPLYNDYVSNHLAEDKTDNAWFFEMVDIGLDIVDPKPMKDLVKDIWEYLK